MRVKSIAMVDIETSGMNEKIHEIIYAHCTILPVNGRISAFSEYAKPKIPLLACVENLTGITNKMLEDKRASCDVARDFKELIKDSIIIGTNKEYLENFLDMHIDNFLSARDMMKIELIENHHDELVSLKDSFDNEAIHTYMVQKRLNIPYGEASLITEILSRM